MLSKLDLSNTKLLKNNPLYQNSISRSLLFTFGLSYLAYKTFGLLKGFLSSVFRFEKNLLERYGKDSWAVITGASDGIGKEFAY